MHKRSFLKNIAIALPAISLAYILLSSCGDKPPSDFSRKMLIGIIRAGVSGLNSALLVNNFNKYEIYVLEVTDRIGGRVFSADSNNSISSKPLEDGPDLIYGNDNAWYEIVKSVA